MEYRKRHDPAKDGQVADRIAGELTAHLTELDETQRQLVAASVKEMVEWELSQLPRDYISFNETESAKADELKGAQQPDETTTDEDPK